MTGRQVAVARAVWGLALFASPERVLPLLTGGTRPGLGTGVLRVLGVRHALQAGITVLVPTAPMLAAGAVADGLHAASALLFARVNPHQRRAGFLDAGVAGAFGAASALAGKGVNACAPSRGG